MDTNAEKEHIPTVTRLHVQIVQRENIAQIMVCHTMDMSAEQERIQKAALLHVQIVQRVSIIPPLGRVLARIVLLAAIALILA